MTAPVREPTQPLGLASGDQAQAFLRVSRTTLWRLERRGTLKPIHIGRLRRYRWSDLQRLAEEGEGGTSPQTRR